MPLVCLAIAACERQAPKPRAADPNAPAVVRVAPPVLPGDTAKPPKPPLVPDDVVMRSLAVQYSLLGAAVVLGDRRLVAREYAPDATLVTPDTSLKGYEAIANRLVRLGSSRSLRDFRRASTKFAIVDSTVVDSGAYVMISKRPGADSVFEKGSYATVWRIHPAPMTWSIISDHLFQSRGASAKRAK